MFRRAIRVMDKPCLYPRVLLLPTCRTIRATILAPAQAPNNQVTVTVMMMTTMVMVTRTTVMATVTIIIMATVRAEMEEMAAAVAVRNHFITIRALSRLVTQPLQ